MGLRVGIDFGTSNSGVAISDGRQVKLLPIDKNNVFPEVVKTILYITRDHQYSIGQEAVEIYYRHNINRLRRYAKKWVGELEYHGADMYYVTDLYAYVDELQPGRLLQFLKTALRTEGFEGTQIFDRYYSVGDLITVYLRLLKERAENLLNDEVTHVTLGRPVKFSNKPAQDQHAQETLQQAAQEAGFRSVSFQLEPVAAALFYELTLKKPETVLIFDFGGGTLDLTLMRLGDPAKGRQVYANGGIDIAGSDFDRAIIQKRMLPHFGKGQVEHSIELKELVNAVSDWMVLPELSVPKARVRLEQSIAAGVAPARLKALQSLIFKDLAFSFYRAVEEAKIDLSSQGAAVIHLDDKDIDLWELYTRYQFERDIQDYRAQIEQVIFETIKSSGLDLDQVDAVVKTGGSSSIPTFTHLLGEIFGPEKVKASNSFSSVTSGLSISAFQNENS